MLGTVDVDVWCFIFYGLSIQELVMGGEFIRIMQVGFRV
jgi:hypothetical protein